MKIVFNTSSSSEPRPGELVEDPDPALAEAREAHADILARARLGGPFYVLGWALTAWPQQLDGLALWLPLALFAALAVLRHRLHRHADGVGAPRAVVLAWCAVLTSGALWGGSMLALLLWTAPGVGHSIALFCTVAFVAAMAHTFAMREGLAAAGILLIGLPPLLGLWFQPESPPGQGLLVLAVGLFLVYALAVLRRSHAEYWLRVRQGIELARQRDQFELQSRRDLLTGLANRRRFEGALRAMAADPRQRGQPFALLMIDCDHFKHINDGLGHAAGDAVLAEFGRRLQRAFPGTQELAARWGGEEFAVLLPATPLAAAAERAEALRAELEGAPLLDWEGAGLSLRISIGVGGGRAAIDTDVDALLKRVDAALYRAKANGRNRIEVAMDGRGADASA
ncbi:MAG: GGDEF domain-containing protein [Aquimonas sp.]|nr:GGDEF domain-containing protein [Aquimonas sp.]